LSRSSEPEATWHVYLVRCDDGSLYTGIATNVRRRLAEHQEGAPRGARRLRGRGPLELVFERAVGDRSLALRLERRIKRLPRPRKEELVERPDTIADLIELLRCGQEEETA
jgi:putative endonuclease